MQLLHLFIPLLPIQLPLLILWRVLLRFKLICIDLKPLRQLLWMLSRDIMERQR
jgi:hypothetical protein